MNKSIRFLACLGAIVTLSQCGLIKNSKKSTVSECGRGSQLFLIPIREIKENNEKVGAIVSWSKNQKETNIFLKTIVGVGYSHDF